MRLVLDTNVISEIMTAAPGRRVADRPPSPAAMKHRPQP
jgi:predicted nucleic acid-binding protein